MKEFFGTYLTIIVLLLQLVVTWALWSLRKTFASKEEVIKVAENGTAQDRRINALELTAKFLPSAQDVTALRVDMQEARGDIRESCARLDGATKLLEGQERLLRTLLEHQLNKGN